MNQFAEEIARITDIRVSSPDYGLAHAGKRERRVGLTDDGRLNIVAADHPARRVAAVGSDPLAMADRADYLARILRALSSPLVDGVMATMDILEELLIVAGQRVEQGHDDPLARKLLIASLNRGGLAGVSWEMDDPISGATAATCRQWNLDGAKLLLRICDEDPGSLRTLVASAEAIRETNALEIPMFLEPLVIERVAGRFQVVKRAEPLAKLVGVASALGDSSRRLWLKLPYCEGYEAVAKATTLPILLLGGESAGDYQPFLREVAAGLSAGPNVRGALVGRNILYPGSADPLVAAEAVGAIVHAKG
ncbi:MAG: deoxyribose-phosphate aldolase [Acidobacteria bacterium]|nr:deoxyribose-phosphate aldolase [Acidobacteriota bacterium]